MGLSLHLFLIRYHEANLEADPSPHKGARMTNPGRERGAEPADRLATRFSAWIDPDHRGPCPTLLIGAGLSFGLVPMANDLATEIAERQTTIEASLGVAVGYPIQRGNADSMYEWAERCIACLKLKDPGLEDFKAKQSLADAMGLMHDRRFLAQAHVPGRGTTPRHRVLARLSREDRVHSMLSFNWDCWLEASFQSVGLRPGSGADYRVPNSWNSHYQVWFKGSDFSRNSSVQSLLKLHGCMSALCSGRGDFVIAKSELNTPLNDKQRKNLINEVIGQQRPVITFGWGASEGYVNDMFTEASQAKTLGTELIIVDPNIANKNYEAIRAAYALSTDQSSVSITKTSPGTTDDLMLWIQTRRGLACMRQACAGQHEIVAVLSRLEQALPAFTEDKDKGTLALTAFFDSWLPVWLRTCFFVGAKQFDNVVEGTEKQILPVDQRDAHVPWAYPLTPRSDLRAAAHLLSHFHITGPMAVQWDFDTFPGALWHSATGRLVIAVPVWAETERVSRAGIKPLVESNHWSRKGIIRELCLLPLHAGERMQPEDEARRLRRWKESIASCFGHMSLAKTSAIADMPLEALAHSTRI